MIADVDRSTRTWPFPAGKAAEIGLVDRIVPNDDVLSAARELLAPILKQAPEAVSQTKQTLLAWLHGEDEEALMRRDNETQADLFEHPEKFERMFTEWLRRDD